jgi:hypothetical protein
VWEPTPDSRDRLASIRFAMVSLLGYGLYFEN